MSSSNCTVTKISRSRTCTFASSFVCTSPLSVSTVVGFFLDFRRASNSCELNFFQLNMCMDAPESTTNSRSSGLFFRRRCQHYPCFGRRVERCFVLVLELVDFFAKSHASPGAHLSCCKVSSCVLSSNFGAHGLRS